VNNKQLAVLILSAITLGGFIGAAYTKEGRVIHKTGSGMFIIDKGVKGDERIYQVLELPTNVTSFVTLRD
jgi:hypothetical protein